MVIGGKYRLSSLLGRGGMGSVFAAQNTLTGKRVAIKCMHRGIAGNPEVSQRFLREAKASARIRHPNVVDVYDVLAENDTFYLVMELLEGEPLSAFLARETTLPQLIEVVLGAMHGVAAAHREGVIHRDIKPENIFLAREGHDHQVVAKVLDFGISKLQGGMDTAITAPGAAVGTITYMSPEQLTGAPDIDGRADVYAFGVILYQAITGRPPFASEVHSVLMLRIMNEQAVPVKTLRPDVPAKLSALIEAAMAKKRDDRIASLDAFIAKLEPFAAGEPSELSAATRGEARATLSSSPARAPRRSLLYPGVAALAVLGLMAALAWFLQSTSAERRAASSGMAANSPHVVTPAPPRAASAPAAELPASAATSGDTLVVGAPLPDDLPPAAAEQTKPASSAARALPARARPDKPSGARRPSQPQAAPENQPAPRVAAACNPNYFFDSQGEKHFKPECF
jgi:eukaryotic-like serine/threonine-protein kinase